MTVRMRHTKGHTRNRRAHHSLDESRLSKCQNCGKDHLRHRVCNHCGQYKGKEYIDVSAIQLKKAERKRDKLRAMGKETGKEKKEKKETKKDESLDPEKLSKK